MSSRDLLRRIGALIVLAIVCTAALASPSRPMRFNHVSVEDGLSQNNVQAILQDSVGYMWFGTENGLNRYDGYTMRHYGRDRRNPDGLANDFIWVIAEDAEQNLWLATQGGGVVRWSRATDSFQSYRHDPEDANSLSSDDVRTVLINADGTVWVGTRDQGVDLLDPRSGTVRHFRHSTDDPASLSNNMVYDLYVDSLQRLWVATDGGLNRLASDGRSFERFRNDPADDRSLSDDRVRTLFEDSEGTLWVGTSRGGLNRFDAATRTFRRLQHERNNPGSLSDNNIRVIYEDNANRFWVGTTSGLNLLDRATGSASRYFDAPGDPQSLNDSYINSIYQDRGGLLWIGTRSAGVSRWNPRSWSLGHYARPWLDDADVTSFASNGAGTVWVGTLGAGVARLDEMTGSVTQFQHRPDDTGTLSDDKVMSLLLDRNGLLWIGTMTGGLNRLDPTDGTIRRYRYDSADSGSLGADGVMAIFEDDAGQIWVGTYGGGISILDTGTGNFRHYVNDPNDSTSLSDQRASAFAQDNNGVVWVGTYGGGLNRFDASTETFSRFVNDPYDPLSLADDTVYALHVDQAGEVWVGTNGGGLDRVVHLPGDKISFENYSQQDGLPSNVINGIQSDASNKLWLSTTFGLTRMDIDSAEFKTFHRGHGLQGEEFNYGASHRAASGRLYFGGANGFNAFHPNDVEEGSYVPNIVLTDFQKLSQPVATDVPYDQLKEVQLGYRDDVVNFSFAALDYTQPAQNTYSYMLEGFDEDWVNLGSVHHVTYTNLDAGNYVLKVSAVTSDGVATMRDFAMPIMVASAPWATPWAYLTYALIVLAALWLMWSVHRNKLQREAEYSRRLEEDVELRTRQLEERNLELQVASRAKSDFLARMSHEIRTPMNGMMGMTQLLLGTKLEEKQHRFAQTINRSAESLLEIINDILDFSKIEAGKLELERVEFNVSELVDETIELFSGAACDKGLELICSTPPGKTVAAVGDPQRLKQVLVNLLGNAVKFTQDGEVVLKYMVTDNVTDTLTLRFEVSDTGVGIRSDNLAYIFKSFSQEDGSTSRRFGGTGLGLAICKQVVEMMGGEIGVYSEPGRGSRFWFTVRLPKAGAAWLSRNVSFRLANLNVLVVDDNQTSSEVVVGYLSALGVRAAAVASGYDALKKLEAAQHLSAFDLVLLDANVGDMSGLMLARAIRSTPQGQTTQIVLLSPAAADLDENEWLQAGVNDCLPKPIRQSALYESLLMLTSSTGTFDARKIRADEENESQARLKGTVLLVEDNPVNQAVALGMLEEMGCETVVAINGQDAIEHISKESFDAVLMDCEMPVMDGFEATTIIRDSVREAFNVPIIALTANAVEGDKERCLASGMQDYLSKPITVERLYGTLSKWLPAESEASEVSGLDAIDQRSLDSIRNLKDIGGDSMVRRVVKLYLSNSSMLVEDLRLAISLGDAEAVRQCAHALKSSSQNVGAMGVAILSQKLEERGRSGNLDGSERFLLELNDLYPKTVDALKAAVDQARAC